MKLRHMHVQNFRSLRDVSLSFQDLTVLIGENDSGKSSVLDILEIVLDGKMPEEKDYFEDANGEHADQISVELAFELEGKEPAMEIPVGDDGRFCIRAVFHRTSSNPEYFVKRWVYTEPALEQDFSRMKREELDDLLERLGISSSERPRNKSSCIELIEEFKKTAPRHVDWSPVLWTSLRTWLPRFERYRAIDYQRPENMVRKTLQSVFVEGLYEPSKTEDSSPSLRPDLQKVESEMRERIAEKVCELLGFIQRYNPNIQRISFDPQIDFEKAFLGGEFLIDDGRGPRYFSRVGDGTKRRILMAVLEWDSQVVQAQPASTLRSLIRAYDEPDTNLHYDAQRLMFRTISELTNPIKSSFDQSEQQRLSVQAIVCTHSPVMIDRAPARSIRLLRLDTDGTTSVEILRTDDEQDIEDFLDLMASELGITNTALFYERCYLIVEGKSEVNALPRLYKRLYGRTLVEDGIRIVNIEGHGAKRSFLKLLGKNRQHLVVALLDRDTDTTQDFLISGFDKEFQDKQLFLIGDTEFEDAFPDDVWCLPLNRVWPRRDNREWVPDDIAKLRWSGRKKFSEALRELVHLNVRDGTPKVKKHDLAYELAKDCPVDKIPQPILDVFKMARQIAGVE